MDRDELRTLSAQGDLDTVVVAAVDYQGRLFGKRLLADYLLATETEGTFASVNALAGDMRLVAVDGLSFVGAHTGADILLRPDYSTARPIPWHDRTALVLADVTDRDGKELPTSPRSALKTQLGRAASMGLEVHTGSELEFYLFRETPESAREKAYRNLRAISESSSDYNLLRSSREEWFLQLLRNLLVGAGIPVESSKAEYGAGQMEVNLLHSEALGMADRHAVCKHAVKEIAQAHGFLASFMAKPFSLQVGSGGHIHLSVKDANTGQSLFWDSRKAEQPTAMLLSFLAGLQLLAPDVFLLYAPYVNSYKRFVPGLMAPSANTAAFDDRTAAFRITGQSENLRIENRLPGADANGYLAMAAMVACGLYGIEHGLRCDPNEQVALPQNLMEAVQRLESSEFAGQLLGTSLVNDLLAFARSELKTYFREVTDWERQTYLEQA